MNVVRLHTAVTVLLVVALATAGCLGTQPDAATETPEPRTATQTATPGTPTTTALPAGDVDFTDGPKERPDRPPALNESAVREYVTTFEYRMAYNSLWINEYSEVTLACRVDEVAERPWGYRAVVTCTGHSETTVPANATATAGPNADWFTQSYRYRIDGNATHRERVETRGEVS